MDYSILNSENAQLLQAIIDDEPSYTKETHSRNAEILKSIINDTEYAEPPQSEIEELLLELKEHMHEDVVVEPLSVTSNGTYSEAGKAYSPVTVEVAPPEDSYQLKSITTPTSLATFEASEMPMPTLKVSVEAKQDLHGYDKPWVGGAGKNKLPNAIPKTETINGVTFKLDSFGVFTVSGTSTAETECVFPIGYSYTIPSGDPSPKIALNNTVNASYASFKFYNDSTEVETWLLSPANRTQAYSGMQGKTCNAYGIYIQAGVSVNFSLSPMIVENSVTDYSFIPYSNECPINGWSEVVVSDMDDVDNPTVTQTTTIPLPQTVYGGEVDVVNGVLRITSLYFEISNFNNWNYQEYTNFKALYNYLNNLGYPPIKNASDRKVISDKFDCIAVGTQQPFGTLSIYTNGAIYFWNNDNAYANKGEMIAALNSIKPAICYELATPITIPLTSTLIKSLNGTNNLSVDSGDVIEGEYFKAL